MVLPAKPTMAAVHALSEPPTAGTFWFPGTSTDFLQACTILHTREVRLARKATGGTDKDLPQISCKRDALLGLPLDGYRTHAESVEGLH